MVQCKEKSRKLMENQRKRLNCTSKYVIDSKLTKSVGISIDSSTIHTNHHKVLTSAITTIQIVKLIAVYHKIFVSLIIYINTCTRRPVASHDQVDLRGNRIDANNRLVSSRAYLFFITTPWSHKPPVMVFFTDRLAIMFPPGSS